MTRKPCGSLSLAAQVQPLARRAPGIAGRRAPTNGGQGLAPHSEHGVRADTALPCGSTHSLVKKVFMEENKTVAKVAALQKQLQAMGRDIDVINFSLGVHTPKILRSLADDIESGKIEVKESKVTVEFDKDPDVQTLKLTTKKV